MDFTITVTYQDGATFVDATAAADVDLELVTVVGALEAAKTVLLDQATT